MPVTEIVTLLTTAGGSKDWRGPGREHHRTFAHAGQFEANDHSATSSRSRSAFAVSSDPELLPRNPVAEMRVYAPFVQEDGLWRRC